MKTFLSLLAVGALLVTTSWVSPGVQYKLASTATIRPAANPNFSFFRTHRQGRGIMATWGMDNNNGVSSFVVERTYEDPNDPYSNWEVICLTPCSNARSFKHHDETVSPGFITYRVTAFFNGGGSMCSGISTEHIVGH
jgi:hypothetical protein